MSSLILRPYQKEALEKALVVKRGTIKAATGTGKTIIALSWLRALDKTALIIVPTQALIYQAWAPKLRKYGFDDVGEYYAYAKRPGPVTLTTFSSAISHPELIDVVDAVVVDEIHHLGSSASLKRLLPKLMEKEYVLGLSSVPERDDDTHELFLKEFPICFDLSIGDALDHGYLSPLSVLSIPAIMSNKEKSAYETLTKKIQKAFRFCGPDLRKWFSCYDAERKEYVGRQAISALARRKKLLSDVESKKEEVLKIILSHPGQRIILFSESVPAVENVRKYLESKNIKCETYHSRIEPWRRQEILEDWGFRYDVLLSCRALEEGLDVKEVAVGILVASGRSKRQFVQRIGRVIRPENGKEAKFYVIFSPGTVEETFAPTILKLITNH